MKVRNLAAVLREMLFYVPWGHTKIINQAMQMLKGFITFEKSCTRTGTCTFTCTYMALQQAINMPPCPLPVSVNVHVPVHVLVLVHEKEDD
jgi:hypothetical protein